MLYDFRAIGGVLADSLRLCRKICSISTAKEELYKYIASSWVAQYKHRDLRLCSIKSVTLTSPPPFIYQHRKPLGVIDYFSFMLVKRSWHCFIISSRLKINGLPVKTSVCKLVFASLRGHIYMLGFKHARNEKLKFHLAIFFLNMPGQLSMREK